MKNKDELLGLTIFRFIAALYVFIFHCNLRYPLSAPLWLSEFLGNGAIGMTFFFVLSGFVLSWAHKDGIGKDYFLKRIARIYPAYIAMGFLSIPFLVDYPLEKILTYVTLFLTGTQSWFPSSFSQWHFGGSWSVSTEAFFYLMFPTLLPIIKRNPIACLVISCFISSLILPVASSINERGTFPLYYIGPIYRIPEFIVGVSLGCIFSNGYRANRSIMPALAISISLLLFASPISNKDWMYNNFITLPATGVLVYFLACKKFNESSYITSIMIYLGRLSYSFYLMQLPIMIYITEHKSFLADLHPLIAWTCIGSVNLIVASICYHAVERSNRIRKVFITASKQ